MVWQRTFRLLCLFSILSLGVLAVSHTSPIEAQRQGPDLIVNTTQVQHVIEEAIYGVNFATQEQMRVWRVPVNRWGGNAQTRYNYQNGVYNPGNHWFFENFNDPDPTTQPYGPMAHQFVAENVAQGTHSIIQIPMMGWVPKDRNETCGFHWDKYGWQTEADWWHNWGCGNGITGDTEEFITWNDPSDTSYAVDEIFGRTWINDIKAQFGSSADGGVRYYALGNEPMLWSWNHRDVHSEPATYDYVVEKGIRYGAMVKEADRNALTMGPGVWGWQPYYYSAYDIDQYWQTGTFPDFEAHGNTPFLAWYLQEMRKHEERTGVRILDYVDIHAYPQLYVGDTPLALSEAGDDEAQALRLRSTRELWDRTWYPESWIPEPIYAIPLMHDWIDGYYPGTRIAITEYSWGANEHINGALAQADVLGIFGRENAHLATLFDPPDIGQPVDYAMRMYRNYDGSGSGFGDLSLLASSGNQMDVSIYAAHRTADGATTVMAINKTKQEQTSRVTLNGISNAWADVYRYSEQNLNSIHRPGNQWVGGSGQFTMTFPAESITLFVIKDGPDLRPNQVFLPIMALRGNETDIGLINPTRSAEAMTDYANITIEGESMNLPQRSWKQVVCNVKIFARACAADN